MNRTYIFDIKVNYEYKLKSNGTDEPLPLGYNLV